MLNTLLELICSRLGRRKFILEMSQVKSVGIPNDCFFRILNCLKKFIFTKTYVEQAEMRNSQVEKSGLS